jgi:hypothetical protein
VWWTTPPLEREGAEAVELLAPQVDLRGVFWRAEAEAGAGPAAFVGEDGEVGVDVAFRGRNPREAPAHPVPVREKWWTSSCGRPSKSSTSVFVPSSVWKR